MFVENEGAYIGQLSTPLGLYWRICEAPVFVWLQVPMNARVQVLLDDYASKEVRNSTPDWQERMLESASALQKSFGKQRMEEIKDLLRAGDYEGFASSLLLYYDARYDKEKKARPSWGSMLKVRVPDDCDRLDAVYVAGQVMAALARFESGAA